MTENKLLKREIRTRMNETGEKYTVARRAFLEDGPEAATLESLIRKPGAVIGIVSSGGGTNLGLAMPALVRHVNEGGQLVVAPHNHGTLELPGAPDFVVARGHADVDEVISWLDADDLESLDQAFKASLGSMQISNGPTSPAFLLEALCLGSDPLLYVQDIQTDPPLRQPGAGASVSEFDLVPENVAAIRRTIEKAGGRAVIGHCIPAEDIEGWEPLAEVCDFTLVIDPEVVVAPDDDWKRKATVEVFDADGRIDSYETTMDTSFQRWRLAL